MEIYIKLIITILISFIVSCSNTSNNNDESLIDITKNIRTDKDIQLELYRANGKVFEAFRKYKLKEKIEIVYRISVNPDGNVIKSEVIKSTSENNKLKQEISDIILKINFNKVKNQEVYTFNYPIVFLPY